MFKRKGFPIVIGALLCALLVLADALGPIRFGTAKLLLSARPLAVLGGLPVTNTLLSGVLALLALSAVALATRRRLADTPAAGSVQNVVESLLERRAPSGGTAGLPAKAGKAVLVALVTYVLATDLLALAPGIGSLGFWRGTGTQRVFLPLLRGATSDWNAMIALALCAVVGIKVLNTQMKATSEKRARREAAQALPPGKRIKRLAIWAAVLALVALDVFGPLRVKEVRIELAAEELLRIGGWRITNSLLSAWIAMVVLIVLGLFASRKLVAAPKAFSVQNIVETVFELLSGFMEGVVGQKARAFFPLVGTLFLYILTMNWLGMLPGVGSVGFWRVEGSERVFVPLLRGATGDLSTTLALALCAVIGLQVYGIRFLGLAGYGSRFVAVTKFVEFFRAIAHGQKAKVSLLFRGFLDVFIGVLDIFEEFTKIFSFSFRLFGNVFAGEVLLLVLAFLVPFLASLPFMLLEMFVGLIQAFIFATLTTAFLGKATTGHTSHASSSDHALPLPEGSTHSL